MNSRSLYQLAVTFGCCVVCGLVCAENPALTKQEETAGTQTQQHGKSRSFEFDYKVSLPNLLDGRSKGVVRIWLPLASTTEAQEITLKKGPALQSFREMRESKYGNRMLFGAFGSSELQGKESLDLVVHYTVVRQEVRATSNSRQKTEELAAKSKEDLSVFLTANRQVPISGKPITLLPQFGKSMSNLERARQIYDQVDDLVKYDKSKPGYGNGDVLWVCDSRTGNCTDFHSLFISMARSQSIPAKFEIGFPIPQAKSGKIGGYHCWAAFLDAGRWIPVDISEADKHPEMKEYYFGNLTADRVQFSTGRDIVLEPPQQGAPLNYFVYPYAEVDGKPVPKDKIQLDFSFRNI